MGNSVYVREEIFGIMYAWEGGLEEEREEGERVRERERGMEREHEMRPLEGVSETLRFSSLSFPSFFISLADIS